MKTATILSDGYLRSEDVTALAGKVAGNVMSILRQII